MPLALLPRPYSPRTVWISNLTIAVPHPILMLSFVYAHMKNSLCRTYDPFPLHTLRHVCAHITRLLSKYVDAAAFLDTIEGSLDFRGPPLDPGGVTGQYPGRHVRLENRRIFRVSSETHFPLSVFVGETGFGLLSARRDQRRRRHGRKDPISKNLEKSSTFCEKSFMHRHFPATSWLPTAPS